MSKTDRIEFYRQFIKTMQKEDFSAEYIAEQLALIVHALYEVKS